MFMITIHLHIVVESVFSYCIVIPKYDRIKLKQTSIPVIYIYIYIYIYMYVCECDYTKDIYHNVHNHIPATLTPS